jgi:hypothetical protein
MVWVATDSSPPPPGSLSACKDDVAANTNIITVCGVPDLVVTARCKTDKAFCFATLHHDICRMSCRFTGNACVDRNEYKTSFELYHSHQSCIMGVWRVGVFGSLKSKPLFRVMLYLSTLIWKFVAAAGLLLFLSRSGIARRACIVCYCCSSCCCFLLSSRVRQC